MNDTLTLVAQKVNNTHELLSAALIRNECRQFMTRDQYEITVQKQIDWWHNEPPWDRLLFLYYIEEYRNKTYPDMGFGFHKSYPVGYGLIRNIHDKWWMSGGLIESFRGKGLGLQLFGHLTKLHADRIVWLEVLRSNDRAFKLYYKLGYREAFRDDRIITMSYTQ